MNIRIGNRIATLRKRQQITQAQLAEYLSVNPQTISRWEADGGMPDITLLPKIAMFFGVSIDDLFGMTDMEQIKNLVYKYSVLRDDKSFTDALQSIDLAVSSIEKQLIDNNSDVQLELITQKNQLLSWKVHLYIQKSRKAENDAETLLDTLLAETAPDNDLYLSLKLQKQQFRIHNGEGASVLENAKNAWEHEKTINNLHCYMAALSELACVNDILNLWESHAVQNIVSPATPHNSILWEIMFCGAVMTKNLPLFKKYFEEFKQVTNNFSIFRVTLNLTELYANLGMNTEKEGCKADLLEMLNDLSLNEYIKAIYLQKVQSL